MTCTHLLGKRILPQVVFAKTLLHISEYDSNAWVMLDAENTHKMMELKLPIMDEFQLSMII